MAKKATRKKWIRFRHSVVRNIAYAILYPYSRLVYRIKITKYNNKGRRFLILMNHQTAFDQFFVGMAFKGPVYYIASEDLFSKGWISKLITWLVAPIPIKKQTTDVSAVMNCMRVAKEGGTIALAPEGNRTYSGHTEYIKPAVVKLIRALKLPVALFRIEGGYGVHPRWSDVVRKGKMRAYVSRVMEPEEYRDLTDTELLETICRELYVHEGNGDNEFYHDKRAEYLERAMYVCPVCGLSVFESHGNHISCKKCGITLEFAPTTELKAVEGQFPFRFVADWYDYQCDFINKLDTDLYLDEPYYRERADFSEVILYKNKREIFEDAELELYGDRLLVRKGDQEYRLDFDNASVFTVVGRNKLNIYYQDKVYQLKSNERFNSLKYMNLFYRYKNTHSEVEHGQFLGL